MGFIGEKGPSGDKVSCSLNGDSPFLLTSTRTCVATCNSSELYIIACRVQKVKKELREEMEFPDNL